jgi:hypothetical protein
VSVSAGELVDVIDVPFLGSEAVLGGWVTEKELRGPRYRRVYPNIYVPTGLPLDFPTRTRCAHLLTRDRGGVLVGYSAAFMHGADCAPRSAPAEVCVPGGARSHPGLKVTQNLVALEDIVFVNHCQVSSPERTAWDLARRLSLVEAVVAVDALALGGAFDPVALRARRERTPGARGCRRLDDVLELVDPRAESPMQTRLRVGLVLAGLPMPHVQYEVLDEYAVVAARLDLAYPRERLAIEYDGSVHFDEQRARLDRRRDGMLAALGWETLRLVTEDVVTLLPTTVNRIRTLLTLRSG